MKSARLIAEMVNHGNDVDDFERYIEYCELAATGAFQESAAEIERLTAALAEIANLGDVRSDEAGTIARRVLDEQSMREAKDG